MLPTYIFSINKQFSRDNETRRDCLDHIHVKLDNIVKGYLQWERIKMFYRFNWAMKNGQENENGKFCLNTELKIPRCSRFNNKVITAN